MTLQHFILTRFNILLWRKDKSGSPVRSREWLEHRFSLFERFCLPSLMGQTCGEFVWIVLFDSKMPDVFRDRIEKYMEVCPQLVPVFVAPENGRNFAGIFRDEVRKRISAERVLTTYLDNDDSLHLNFVEDVQRRAIGLVDGTVINYNQGFQFFAEDGYVLRRDFGLDETVRSGLGLFLFRFLPRYVRTFFVRVKYFFFGRKW